VSTRADAIVVGAGIVGAACAEALTAAGMRVLVLEAGFVGAGTTAAAMGHLVVMDDSPAQFTLTTHALELWRARSAELPKECELQRCGTLWIAADAAELAHLKAKAASYRAGGVAVELLDGLALEEAEPHLRSGLAGALRVPGDAVLYPPAAARFLLERARSSGAELREGACVQTLAPRRVTTSAGALDTDVVVNAAGVDAPRLMPGLPVEPRKGHLVITERHPGFVRHQLIELGYLKSAHEQAAESVAFNVQPRPGGQLLIGSSREFVGHDGRVNRPLRARMLERACGFMPELRALTALRTWTGFRPATPDGLPLIGAWAPGLYVAAGHEGLGVTTSLATGQLLADLVTGRTPALDPLPYAPRRTLAARAHARA
jgi:D-hydroxyproline dehydrogenase subunit beta